MPTLQSVVHTLIKTLCLVACLPSTNLLARPNVVIVITDDQGYGDVACHGNPIIQTPHIDALASESVSLVDYHVAPTCSPTRAAFLTGHWTNRTGVWHTINGRSMLRANEITLGQLFQDAGYQTGMFGKWHLGDNYPYRAEDRGFGEVYRHGGGGVGQTPDVWDNSYFDGGYFHNGTIEAASGFCTDVFFDQASEFIRRCAEEKQPFFAYIATNAPHGPLHAPKEYLDRYSDQEPAIATFFAMITNIDDNVGRLRELLDELKITDDTILIFTTDNGTASGERIFNAGMRGKKGSEYEGGHRVPFFIHWPNGKLRHGAQSSVLAHAVDVAPTLLDLAGIPAPEAVKFDGQSLRPILNRQERVEWQDRMLVTDSQRVRDPIKYRKSSVMSQRWRLVNGSELYDITQDPGQQLNVASQFPDQVKKMRAFYDAWWKELEPTFAETTEIYVGHEEHPVVSMTAHDWIDQAPPWHQGQIRDGSVFNARAQERRQQTGAKAPKHNGHWAVKVLKSGNYRISLRRWPLEADQPITASLPPGSDVPGASTALRARPGVALKVTEASVRIDGNEVARGQVRSTDHEVSFDVEIQEGSRQLSPVFLTPDGEVGAYYVIVTSLD